MLTKAEILMTVKVAEMYFILDMNHDEIAEKLGITLSAVYETLNNAAELGIVEIRIGWTA